MALFTATNLSKRIGGRSVLWDISLEVDPGEILGVFGRSDSGKTALARVLAGLDEPSGGAVNPGEPEAEPRISLALERPAAAPELTVYENLGLFAALWGVPRKRRAKEISSLLELMRLSDRRSVRAEALSSGALRRLELARALIADSPLTVIDGLLDSLDSDILEKLWEHLLTLRREGKSFLITTSSGRIAEMCGRIAVLSRGRIGFLGRPDDFRRLAGEDLVVLGDVKSPLLRNKIQERLAVVIQEEEGFLSFRVTHGERVVSDMLAEFGSELSCVYLKRPTLEDALDVLAGGGTAVVAGVGGRE